MSLLSDEITRHTTSYCSSRWLRRHQSLLKAPGDPQGRLMRCGGMWLQLGPADGSGGRGNGRIRAEMTQYAAALLADDSDEDLAP